LLTRRLLYAYFPLITPLTLPLTTSPQKKLGAAQFPTFGLLYAQTQLSSLGLPVGFYHFVQRNYSWNY
jgi:hypothetical protein